MSAHATGYLETLRPFNRLTCRLASLRGLQAAAVTWQHRKCMCRYRCKNGCETLSPATVPLAPGPRPAADYCGPMASKAQAHSTIRLAIGTRTTTRRTSSAGTGSQSHARVETDFGQHEKPLMQGSACVISTLKDLTQPRHFLIRCWARADGVLDGGPGPVVGDGVPEEPAGQEAVVELEGGESHDWRTTLQSPRRAEH